MPDIIKTYINTSLDFIQKYKEYLMYLSPVYTSEYDEELNPDMQGDFDFSQYSDSPSAVKFTQVGTNGVIANLIHEDSKSWKPLDANISAGEIEGLENYFAIKLPEDYSDIIAENFTGLLTLALESKEPEVKGLNPAEKRLFG